MNTSRLADLRASILDPDKPFDFSVCETCIAGHAYELAIAEGLAPESFTQALQQWLDIPEASAFDIFGGRHLPLGRSMRSITREEAVQVLDHFATHGSVDFRILPTRAPAPTGWETAETSI